MSANDAFFQFPLSTLAYGDADHKARLHAIVDWCIVDRANVMQAAHTKAELRDMIESVNRDTLPGGFDNNRAEHLAIIAARMMLRINGGSVSGTKQIAAAVASFVSDMAVKYGRFPVVRIRNDLLWDCIHGSMKYRDFSVLCAVYAVIGAKEYPVIITRNRIIAGALGYKSPSIMTPESIEQRADGADPLTENQVRRTLDELERRNLFARIQASKRKVYFSHRMTRAEMAEQIIKSRVKKATTITKHRADDRLLRERIALTIKAVNCPPESPRIHRMATKPPPPDNHDIHRFNISRLIQSSLTETEIKETSLTQGVSVDHSLNQGKKKEEPRPEQKKIADLERWITMAREIAADETKPSTEREEAKKNVERWQTILEQLRRATV